MVLRFGYGAPGKPARRRSVDQVMLPDALSRRGLWSREERDERH
jgi:hypothetical protein